MQLFLAKTGFIQKPICAERFLLSILTGNGFLCDMAQVTKYRYVHQTETCITQTLRERLRAHKVFTKDQFFYLNYHKFSITSYVLDVY